jgi:hypothetical protein
LVQQIAPGEMQTLLQAFKNPDSAYASGIVIDGQKYTVIQVMDDVLRLKKASVLETISTVT